MEPSELEWIELRNKTLRDAAELLFGGRGLPNPMDCLQRALALFNQVTSTPFWLLDAFLIETSCLERFPSWCFSDDMYEALLAWRLDVRRTTPLQHFGLVKHWVDNNYDTIVHEGYDGHGGGMARALHNLVPAQFKIFVAPRLIANVFIVVCGKSLTPPESFQKEDIIKLLHHWQFLTQLLYEATRASMFPADAVYETDSRGLDITPLVHLCYLLSLDMLNACRVPCPMLPLGDRFRAGFERFDMLDLIKKASPNYSETPVSPAAQPVLEESAYGGSLDAPPPPSKPTNYYSESRPKEPLKVKFTFKSPELPQEFEVTSVKDGKLAFNGETKWYIPASKLHLRKLLGHGTDGVVYVGTLLTSLGMRLVAVKNIPNPDKEPELATRLTREAEKAAELENEHIIKFWGLGMDSDAGVCIVTDIALFGSLDALNEEILKTEHKLEILHRVARALAYMHGKSMVHCDVALRNVLLRTSYTDAKLGDFGLCQSIPQGQKSVLLPDFLQLPLSASAPETLLRREVSFQSDVWMFGILILTLFGDRNPYPKIRDSSTFLELLERHRPTGSLPFLRPELAATFECPIRELMYDCLKENPAERPSMERVVASLDKVVQQYVRPRESGPQQLKNK